MEESGPSSVYSGVRESDNVFVRAQKLNQSHLSQESPKYRYRKLHVMWVDGLAFVFVFVWWILLTVGFWGKAIKEGFSSYGTYLTNWSWTVHWIIFTFILFGEIQFLAARRRGILRWTFILVFWVGWAIAWLVYWLVFLLLYDNPDLLIDAGQAFYMGIIFVGDRVYHVVPAVSYLVYVTIRIDFVRHTFAYVYYGMPHENDRVRELLDERGDPPTGLAEQMWEYERDLGTVHADNPFSVRGFDTKNLQEMLKWIEYWLRARTAFVAATCLWYFAAPLIYVGIYATLHDFRNVYGVDDMTVPEGLVIAGLTLLLFLAVPLILLFHQARRFVMERIELTYWFRMWRQMNIGRFADYCPYLAQKFEVYQGVLY